MLNYHQDTYRIKEQVQEKIYATIQKIRVERDKKVSEFQSDFNSRTQKKRGKSSIMQCQSVVRNVNVKSTFKETKEAFLQKSNQASSYYFSFFIQLAKYTSKCTSTIYVLCN